MILSEKGEGKAQQRRRVRGGTAEWHKRENKRVNQRMEKKEIGGKKETKLEDGRDEESFNSNATQ